MVSSACVKNLSFIKIHPLAELAYWHDLNNNPDQTIWSANGGQVNVYEKVFGCGAGELAGGGYLMTEMSPMENAAGENPGRHFSVPIMAGSLLGKDNCFNINAE